MLKNLKKIREKNNLSMTDLANNIDISVQRYSNYEKGTREADYETLQKLSNYFEVTIDYLIGNEQKKYPVPKAQEGDISYIKELVMGSASCGTGVVNLDTPFDESDLVPIPTNWLRGYTENNCFYMIALGDSMIGARIFDGCKLLFAKADAIHDGQIGLFTLNGEQFIKKYRKLNNGGVILLSANPDFTDIEVDEHDDFIFDGLLLQQYMDFNL